MSCPQNLRQLGQAIKIHAKMNDGQIPKAQSIEDLLRVEDGMNMYVIIRETLIKTGICTD